MSAPFLIISCGGTFDKSRFTRSGKFVCGDPMASAMLKAAGIDAKHCEVQSLMKKDSLDMDDADRNLVRRAVIDASQDRIVIVHGTDTLVQTALALENATPDKTVVLVGALSPAIFTGSDASFNLGFALAVACGWPPGVWVAMHGHVWPSSKVQKDTKIQRFVDL